MTSIRFASCSSTAWKRATAGGSRGSSGATAVILVATRAAPVGAPQAAFAGPAVGAVPRVEAVDEVVGYAYGTLEGRDWNMLLDAHGALHDVLVDEGARGAGAGRALVAAMVAALRERGAPRVVLSTMVTNEAAQRVFRACGFRPTMLEMTCETPTASPAAPGTPSATGSPVPDAASLDRT